jgi:hypothetical protein
MPGQVDLWHHLGQGVINISLYDQLQRYNVRGYHEHLLRKTRAKRRRLYPVIWNKSTLLNGASGEELIVGRDEDRALALTRHLICPKSTCSLTSACAAHGVCLLCWRPV